MIVCHCHAVTDREIREAVRDGADSVEAVSMTCGASGGCGGCRPEVESIVACERLSGDLAVLQPVAPLTGLRLAPQG